MDKIQVHKGYAAPAARTRSAPPSLAINPAAVKTTSHYVGALRRRFWMVLMIAVPMAIASSILVLRLPSVYLARGEIEINPPTIDPVLSALMTHEPGRHDPAATASYVPNHEAWLRSKGLAQKVVNDPSLAIPIAQYADPAFELFKSLYVLRMKGTNSFVISLEGNDPAQTKKLLEMLLLQFEKETRDENDKKLEETAVYAQTNLDKLKDTQHPRSEDSTGAAEIGHDRARRPQHSRRALCESHVDHVATAHSIRRAPAAINDVTDYAEVRF